MLPRKFILLCLLAAGVRGQSLTVTGSVVITRPAKTKADHANAVVWLQPVRPSTSTARAKATYTILQKDKQFDPHVLAVPAGSLVAFPNFDPFFHNVFSMFDGKRFDLGLYEAGASRTAAFNKAGVCYIFCNIHPEMSAIIVVVDTPYYVTTNVSGKVSFAGVAPGEYRLMVWHERAQAANPTEFPRVVTISQSIELPPIKLTDSGQLSTPHKNKYGRDYESSTTSPNYR